MKNISSVIWLLCIVLSLLAAIAIANSVIIFNNAALVSKYQLTVSQLLLSIVLPVFLLVSSGLFLLGVRFSNWLLSTAIVLHFGTILMNYLQLVLSPQVPIEIKGTLQLYAAGYAIVIITTLCVTLSAIGRTHTQKRNSSLLHQ